MNTTEELLLFIGQNTRMGIENLATVLTFVKPGSSLHAVLEGQRKGYVNLNDEAVALLHKHHIEPKDAPFVAKMWAFISTQLHTLADKSEEHIAALLIEGTTMGIIDIQRHINDAGGAAPEALEIANTLLHFQEGAVAKFKEYL